MSSLQADRVGHRLTALVAAVVIALRVSVLSAEPVVGPTQVMLVGTYHFSNPGQDLNNVKAVDVLTPQRQREIESVTQSLARFAPDRVAVEWPAQLVDERYEKYLGGTRDSHNEVVQLGFRLAHARQLKHVHGLDVEGDFPFDPVVSWAKAHGREGEINRMMADGAAEVARISALQDRMTIGGVLLDLNQPASIARNHSFYSALLDMGSGAEQPGAALVAAWYARNLTICARLLQVIKHGERVVVFYGQGHIYLLRQCLREQPDVEMVDALGYLP